MDTKQLALTAAKARLLGLDMVYGAASGHLGGSFSAMDLLTVPVSYTHLTLPTICSV